MERPVVCNQGGGVPNTMADEPQLPPLAGLRIIGEPTAMEAAPASQRPRRDPDAPSALATASGDAIALVITHAGINARKSDNPPLVMCEWMKNFCRAGKYQGVAGCEDQWYFHALAAFGIDPMSNDIDGGVPEDTGFKSWRELFGTLCECFYGFAAPLNSGPVINSVALQTGQAPFWNYTKSVMGGGPPTRAFVMRFVNPEANQRELDVLMNGLFEGWVSKKVLHKGTPDEIRRNRSNARNELADSYAAWNERRGLAPSPQPRRPTMGVGQHPIEGWPSNDASPWMAMVTLLDLRGAEPWQLGKYRAVDRELYAAIYFVTQTPYITPETAAEQLEKVRSALDRYADPNYNGSLEERVYPLVTPTMPDPPPVLQQAVMASDGPILKLLLDRGAVLPSDGSSQSNNTKKHEFFDALLFATAFSPLSEWRVDRETTERLIGMLLPFVRSLPTHGLAPNGKRRSYINARIERALAETNNNLYAMPQWLRDAWRTLIWVPWSPARRFHGERA